MNSWGRSVSVPPRTFCVPHPLTLHPLTFHPLAFHPLTFHSLASARLGSLAKAVLLNLNTPLPPSLPCLLCSFSAGNSGIYIAAKDLYLSEVSGRFEFSCEPVVKPDGSKMAKLTVSFGGVTSCSEQAE